MSPIWGDGYESDHIWVAWERFILWLAYLSIYVVALEFLPWWIPTLAVLLILIARNEIKVHRERLAWEREYRDARRAEQTRQR